MYMHFYNMESIKRTLQILGIALCGTVNATAYVNMAYTKVDGVNYKTDFYQDITRPESGADWHYVYTLPFETKYYVEASAERCQAEIVGKEFLFYDGSRVPAMEYGALLWKSNFSPDAGLPNYDADKDEEARRPPYYAGDVWLQDMVNMRDLRNLRNTKDYIVYDMLPDRSYRKQHPEMVNKFNEKLLSIRTPRYAVVRTGLFKDCTGLRTARIGAAQCVEAKAFENCTRLETVFFESAPYVETEAFLNCPNIKYVVMDTKLPQAPEGSTRYYDDDQDPFDEQVYSQATLYVREDQMEAFRNDLTWGKFKNIRDIEEYLTGIETVNPDSQVGYEVYDLSGVKVRSAVSGENWRKGLPAGLYIVKSTLGTVKKEYIR